ncbi:MAG: NAD(P)/FAD-dependent oxidoreductase [Rhodospirillaceae bacterium]
MVGVSGFRSNAASGKAAGARLRVAVIGSGISGLSAAWLLSSQHDVVLYEQAARLGGHAHTVVAPGGVPVDMGFIVFNRVTYPNLTALLAHLGVSTRSSDMSFAASLDDGGFEYSGADLAGLFAQKRNLLRPRFWSMLWDIHRFYRNAERHAAGSAGLTLGEILADGGYGPAFRDDHLLPMASAIWSSTPADMLSFPALAFIRFHANHGLLQITGRPVWETVSGGSIEYVKQMAAVLKGRIRTGAGAVCVLRTVGGVDVIDALGHGDTFDHVVIAAHADQALAMLADPTPEERALLGAFRYQRNRAVLHQDPRFMPRRRAAWASWNYISGRGSSGCFTYWMNRLQLIPDTTPLFVTLNPPVEPNPDLVVHREDYDHPLFDAQALAAQSRLWELQGMRRTWFCGAHFGAGFHEDGLQAGLAVAEQLGGVRRPWTVANESGRIGLAPVEARDLRHPVA